MRDDHLQAFKRDHLGRGYVERVPGTGKLLDTEHGRVRAKFLELWQLAQTPDPF